MSAYITAYVCKISHSGMKFRGWMSVFFGITSPVLYPDIRAFENQGDLPHMLPF